MAAIITSDFRKNSRQIFINDIKTSTVDDYFIGLGKTDSWPDSADAEGNAITEYNRNFSAPLPTDTIQNKEDVLKNLMVLVKTKAAEVFTVVPRNNWAYNRVYKIYDPTDPRCFDYETIDGVAHYPCYVTSNDRIYICLSNVDGDGEVVESTTPIPSGAGSTHETYHSPRALSDGYVWAYVTLLDDDSKFYTDQFVNYTYPSDSDYTTIENATGGLVYGFKIINGGGPAITDSSLSELKLIGTGYSGGELTPVSDVIITDTSGSTTDFNVIFGANGIEKIEYKDPTQPGDPFSWKTGFESASIVAKVNGVVNTDIQIVPYVLPYNGLGRNPDSDLPSYYAGIAVDFIGEVDGEAPVGYNVDVRQISLIKNPTRNPDITSTTDNDDDTNQGFYTHDEAYDALKYISLSAGTLTRDYIGRDFIIEQQSTGAKAWLDYADNVNEKLYYHQNSSNLVNFKRFEANSITDDIIVKSITGYDDGERYQCIQVDNPEYLPETGEVIFYENRKPINRNYNQTDEVKLVIQF
jgi:hypothetical protein